MFYAIALIPKPINDGKGCYIRSLKTKGFKSLDAAKKALLKSKNEGYVKKLGVSHPIWSSAE